MKTTIKKKLFIYINALIIFFVLMSWFANSQFLTKYYVVQKKNELISNYNNINKLYQNGLDSLSLELERVSRLSSVHILIMDSRYKTKYDSSRGFRNMNQKGGQPKFQEETAIIKFEMQYGKIEIGGHELQIIKDARLKTNFLNLYARLNNQDILVLSTPITAIRESAEIANRFFVIIGFITVILGSISALVFSSTFSKPILELNGLAQKMSKLDFSHRYKGNTKDEIGELGTSINSLAKQLDKSITELKDVNSKLLEDVERERKIDEMRKSFISNVSHELKTPIALIQGYAEGLQVNVNDDEENKNYYCEVIIDESKKMNSLLMDLLDLSKIEAGYFKLDKIRFDISEFIKKVLNKYQPIFEERSINVETDIDLHQSVLGDKRRIEQVLVNYINNSIDHIECPKVLKISTKVNKDKVRIIVYNTGKQITKKDMDNIWTSFYKVDKARTRDFGGAGLGLSIVKSIMEFHNNEYGTSNVDDGVEFWFELDWVF